MRSDLLQRIGTYKELENVIVLTHNFDGVFLESVILPILRKSGNPTLTIFAEASCAIEAYESQRRLLSGLGIRYRLVPVELNPPFRFHPKAVLLSGPDQAILFVGSGNLGFGGWRENGEVWAEYLLSDTSQIEAPAFAYFRNYLSEVLDKVPISGSVRHDVEEAFGQERKRWVAYLGEPGLLIGRVGHGPSLADKLNLDLLSRETAKFWVCSPYFDEQGEAIRKLAAHFSTRETVVLLQEKQTNLTAGAVSGLPDCYSLKSLGFKSQEDNAPRFVHAKFYGIEQGNLVTVILGSANCSNAAWFIPGTGGNAELVAVQEMTKEDFMSTFLNELDISDKQPKLEDKEAADEELHFGLHAQLRVLAARFMKLDGAVRVGFKKAQDVQIIECMINDQPFEFQVKGENELVVMPTVRPIFLRLRGTCPDGEVLSNRIWVDHEFELSSSSKERTLVDNIHQSVRDGVWGLPAWIEIMKLLQDHLEYLAPRGIAKAKRDRARDEGFPTVRFTRSDVFSKEFGLSPGSVISSWEPSQGRLDGLRQLLLRWFGFGWGEDEVAPGGDDSDPGDETTDILKPKPTDGAVRKERPKPPDQELLKKEQRRAADLLKIVVGKISEVQYIERRPPELMAKDLGIIAILMTSALTEGWLSEKDYFEATHKVWRRAFFDDSDIAIDPKGKACGYLEKLHGEAEDPDRMMEALATVDFAAALATWALATQKKVISPEQGLLSLTQVMAVARLPWVWRTDAVEELRDQIRRLLIHTGLLRLNNDRGWTQYCSQWDELIKTGYAMNEFEAAFKDVKIDELKKMVRRNEVKRGELLWQTAQGGFYILREDSQRDMNKNARVLKLQSRESEKEIKSGFLIPLNDLLSNVENEGVPRLPKEAPGIIKNFIKSITSALVGMEISHIEGVS
jgi:hypothetical protein